MFTISRSQKWFLKIRTSTVTMTAIIATAIIALAIAISTEFCDLSFRSPARIRHVPILVAAGSTSRSYQLYLGKIGFLAPRRYSFTFLRRSALVITETELKLMAAPAIMGLSSRPKNG